MAAVYQSSNMSGGKPDGSKGRILTTSNSGSPDNRVSGYIYPGPQGRGIRRESVILKNGWQTTAKNPIVTNFGKKDKAK